LGKLLEFTQLMRASYLAGQGKTVEEIADDLRVRDQASIRQNLATFGVRLTPKPFGFRPVTVRLSPAQIEGLHQVAASQGIAGEESHVQVLEQAGRRLGADPELLKAVLDPTLRPVFIEDTYVEGLEAEAKTRGIKPGVFAGKLLAIIAKDRMYGAVIDEDG